MPAVNPQFFLFRPHWTPLCWYHLVAEKLAFKKRGISQGHGGVSELQKFEVGFIKAGFGGNYPPLS